MRNVPVSGQHGSSCQPLGTCLLQLNYRFDLLLWPGGLYNCEDILISIEMLFILTHFLLVVDAAHFVSVKSCSHSGMLKFKLNLSKKFQLNECNLCILVSL